MSYTYNRPITTKPPNTSTPTNNPKPSPSSTSYIPKQLTRQQLKIYQSVFLLIGYVIKSNQNKKIKQSFLKLKSHVVKRKKYSQLLTRKLGYLFRQKQKQYTNLFFSCLVSNKIAYYNSQMQRQKTLKQSSKQRATGIMFWSVKKLFAKKTKTYFNQLRVKSIQYSKSRLFKTTHILARLSTIYRQKLSQTMSILSKNRLRQIKINKLLNKLSTFVSAKNRRNVSSLFSILKLVFYRSKQSTQLVKDDSKPQQVVRSPRPSKINQPSTSIINTPSALMITAQQQHQQQKRQLQTRQRQLTAQLTQLQQSSSSTLTSLKNDITRQQKQLQSLRFNDQLLEQNNHQLQNQLQLLLLKNRKKLPRNQIWQNVYNNLIYFLSLNRNKTITKQQLIQAMQLPLVPCGGNIQQITQQNKVLQQLLQEYKNSFPQPQVIQGVNGSSGELTLPYDLLRKKNKYYYMVLEVLAEWGGAGSRELQQLNKDLEMLQKRLSEV